MKSEFHTIITSNVNDSRNKSGHFFNTLSTPFNLQGSWSVGVKKIIYLNNFLNIINEKFIVNILKRGSGIMEPYVVDGVTVANAFGIKYNQYKHFNLKNLKVILKDLEEKEIPTEGASTPNKFKNIFIEINDDATEPPILGSIKITVEYSLDKIDWKPWLEFTRHLKNTDPDYDAYAIPKLDETNYIRLSWEKWTLVEYQIKSGNYSNYEGLITSFPVMDGVEVSTSDSGRVKISLDKTIIDTCSMEIDLHLTLGFVNQTISEAVNIAEYMPQMNRGRFAFFIYSNLVQTLHVGETEVPLLDVISIPRKEFAEVVSLDVINPLYRPLSISNIHEIEIKLAMDNGEVVAFNNEAGNAKTLLLLHFVKT